MQQTLNDGWTAEPHRRPATLVYCPQCDDHVLRSRVNTHPHDIRLPTPRKDRREGTVQMHLVTLERVMRDA